MLACYKPEAYFWVHMKYLKQPYLWQFVPVLLIVSSTFFFIAVPESFVAGETSITATENLPSGGLLALPGYVYAFPHDHGSHDQFGLEWWYFTGHLFSESGRRFGYELTFFRKAMDNTRVQNSSSRWAIEHLYFAHLALTDVESQIFSFAERLSRDGLGKAGAKVEQMDVWIDLWSVYPVTPDHQVLALKAADTNFGLDLILALEKSPVIHGNEGVSRKGSLEGQASHYYSLTRLDTKGKIVLGKESIQVTGLSWMDHEFGSGELGDDQVGWDWFSLQFDTNMELMVYLLRKKDGSPDPASSGTIIFPDGRAQHLPLHEIEVETRGYWTSPHTAAKYPAQWVLNVPSVQLSVQIVPFVADQELRTSKSTQVTYWEGAAEVKGQFQGSLVQGNAYVELTGYSRPLVTDRK